jgi:hypothetical protein
VFGEGIVDLCELPYEAIDLGGRASYLCLVPCSIVCVGLSSLMGPLVFEETSTPVIVGSLGFPGRVVSWSQVQSSIAEARSWL